MKINPSTLPPGTKILIKNLTPDDAYYSERTRFINKIAKIVGTVCVFDEVIRPEYTDWRSNSVFLISIEGEVLNDPDDNY